jgi:hypothetical protein
MKKNLFVLGIGFLLIGASIFSACTKEGPMGKNGKDGTNGIDGKDGKDGVDGGTNCQECHNPAMVELKATEFEFSKHSYGEAAFEESGNVGCTPCHSTQAFLYVCKNNVSSAFIPSTTTAGRWTNGYATIPGQSLGEINCATCHSSLHTTYGKEDFSPLTTVAKVSMTFNGGAKEINLPADGGISNLCVKCHQPRPFANSNTNGNVLNYDSLVSFPNVVFYDVAQANGLNKIKPGYRTHTHYGTVGAIYAGKGGVEFPGTAYTNSFHTAGASCQDCHMATQANRTGGHTFVASGNFSGCNATGCHTGMNSSSAVYTATRADAKAKLETLAGLLKVNGIEIMNRNPDTEANLWVTKTSNKYDGYLNIYDPINNPDGIANNVAGGGTFKNPGSTSGWSAAQIATNNGLPLITLTNKQMGAIINFQLCLREYSLGIHNTKYTMALLNNTIAALQTK